jgi:phosphate transport system permease protein
MIKINHLADKTMRTVFFLCGSLAIITVIFMAIFLLKESFPVFQDISWKDLWLSANWNPTGWDGEHYGIWSILWGSFFVTGLTLIISVPIGILCALFLSEIAPKSFQIILKPAVELLAGIPSVVIGFIGLVMVGPLLARTFHLNNGLNVLNGSLMLSIMVLPTIISLSEDAIAAVPKDFRLASLAMGATKLETIFKVVLPAAKSGIFSAVMLGMGRAIGETMAVLMACGNVPEIARSIFDPVRTLTSTIAIEMGEVAYDTTPYYALFTLGLYLFLISFTINYVADYIVRSSKRKAGA